MFWQTLNMDTIGKRVKRLRLARGISQRELARLCGCSGPAISDIENGHSAAPSSQVLIKMSKALNTTERYILFGEDGEIKIPTQEQAEILAAIDALPSEKRDIVLSLIRSLAH